MQVTGVRPDVHEGSWGRRSGMSGPYCRYDDGLGFESSCTCAEHVVEHGFAPGQSRAPCRHKPAVHTEEVLHNDPGVNRLHLFCPIVCGQQHPNVM